MPSLRKSLLVFLLLCTTLSPFAQIAKIELPKGQWAFQIAEDNIGNIWVGLSDGDTGGNLALVHNDSLIIKSGNQKTPSGSYHAFVRLPNGNLIFGGYLTANNQHYLVHIKNGDPDTIPIQTLVPTLFVNSITWINNREIWLGTTNGVLVKKPEGWIHLNVDDGLPHPLINAIEQDFRNVVWIGTEVGMAYYMDGTIQTLEHSSRAIGNVTQYFNDSKGYLWCGSRFSSEGISAYNGRTWETFSARHGLADNSSSIFYQDSKGRLWSGSCFNRTRGGLSSFDGRQWSAYTSPAFLSKPCVDAIAEDTKGRLWFGGSLTSRKGKGITILDGNQWLKISPQLGFPVDRVITFFADSQGRMWVSSMEGLYIVDINKLDILTLNQNRFE